MPPKEASDEDGHLSARYPPPKVLAENEAAPFSVQSPSDQGWVRVDDQNGNMEMINVGTDLNKCASVHQPIYWNVHSLYQYKGAACFYWKWACKLTPQLLFTVDARGGDVYLPELPESFGSERHKIGQINCMEATAAAAYFEGLDTANMTIIGGEHATIEIPTIS